MLPSEFRTFLLYSLSDFSQLPIGFYLLFPAWAPRTPDVLGDEGARFENLVATSLLKRLHFLEDRDGYRYKLRYIRDKEGREVDFAILKEGKLIELVEAKQSDENISGSLLYYAERLRPEKATQIAAKIRRPYDKGGIRVTDALGSLLEVYETRNIPEIQATPFRRFGRLWTNTV